MSYDNMKKEIIDQAAHFGVRGGSNAGTTRFNGRGASRQYGGVASSSITITEYSA
tara:strand:- start:39 stop:203 length:165 start_codon:yes stop_codon:yes gene_type:complete